MSNFDAVTRKTSWRSFNGHAMSCHYRFVSGFCLLCFVICSSTLFHMITQEKGYYLDKQKRKAFHSVCHSLLVLSIMISYIYILFKVMEAPLHIHKLRGLLIRLWPIKAKTVLKLCHKQLLTSNTKLHLWWPVHNIGWMENVMQCRTISAFPNVLFRCSLREMRIIQLTK